MKREEIVGKILALSSQTGLPGSDADAYAGAELPALVDLLNRLEGIVSAGRTLRERHEVPETDLAERVADIRHRREEAIDRLSARLDRLTARTTLADSARSIAEAAVATTVAPGRGVSLQELLRQREKLERQIAALRTRDQGTAVARIRELMSEYGLTPADLQGAAEAPAAVVKVLIDPKTGKTWSGRGRRPKWVIAMELAAQTTRR